MESAQRTFADSFKVSLEVGDIVVEFGRIAAAPAGGTAAVSVSERIVMPLDTSRRLVHSLNDALRPHAAAVRAAQARTLAPGQAAVAARPGQGAVRAPPDEAGEKAALLFRLVGALGVPCQYERSFRISECGLQANRFLLTVDQADIAGDRRERVLEICQRLGMPGALLSAAREHFPIARCVHFGFEGDAGSILCKLYLERIVPAEEARGARARAEPVMLHLAFKWDPDSEAHVTTQYLWHPDLSAPEIEGRLAQHVYRDGPEASLAIARAVLALAAGKVAAQKLQYLEVEEKGTGRRSFDLNVYNARLQVKDLQLLLHRMRELYAVRPGQFQALYDQIKMKLLGHLAGGVHRNGQDFFNLYYGVTGFPHFHEGFR
jgi:tryptophan halogenase